MENNNSEMQGHMTRNESMWNIWKEHGVNSETELTVNFHFYSASKQKMELLCEVLQSENIVFDVKVTRTLIFLKGWEISADITKKWTLPELQAQTGNFYIMSKQVGVSLEGCGAKMPK